MFGLALVLPCPNTVGAVVVEVLCPNMLVLAAVVAAACPKTFPPPCPKPDGLHMGCPKNEPLDVVAEASELTGCPNMLVVFCPNSEDDGVELGREKLNVVLADEEGCVAGEVVVAPEVKGATVCCEVAGGVTTAPNMDPVRGFAWPKTTEV